MPTLSLQQLARTVARWTTQESCKLAWAAPLAALSNLSRPWTFFPMQTISSLARILIVVGVLRVEVMTVNATGAVFDVLRAHKRPNGEYRWLLADADAPAHQGLDVVLGRRDKPGGLAVRITEVVLSNDRLLCKGAGW